jgi:DNA polymerase-1
MITPIRQEGYELLHKGAIALAQVEANGIRIDLPHLAATKARLEKEIRSLSEELQQDKVWKIWRREYGSKAKLTSYRQLAEILYRKLNFQVTSQTESGQDSANDEALQKIDHPFVQKISRFYRYNKALGTFLSGIEREIAPDGRLHPSFSLHTARSMRSSSSEPNFQNFPVRDKEIAEIIRSLFIASSKSVLVENDFKGIEVALSASYHKDPNFISYINTPGKDMHRDMAAQIYLLEPKEVSKDARYGAKNKFVFPQFYGDYYLSCAQSLWEWIEKGKLLGPDGKSLFHHLKQQGITGLGACDPDESPEDGTFEAHLQEVENDFWNNRFRVYGKWKRSWHELYMEKGYFDMLTGFRVEGFYNRKQVCNYPIQGSAFHCLLWSLIRINRILMKHQMRSKVVGQIHDSLIGDVKIRELRDYLEIVEQVTTVDLRKHYDWLIVPPEIEYEIAPPGVSWFGKREIHFKQGIFTHPTNPNKHTDDPVKFAAALERLKS